MSDKETPILSVGQLVTLDIGPVAHGGHFIARHNGRVIFVRHAISGEKTVVRITSVTSKLAHGDAVEILVPSKDRVSAPCVYAVPGGCGGCDFQHVSIEAQRDLKKFIIQDQFKRIAKMDVNPEFIHVEPETGLHWRTRFDLSVSRNGKAGLFSHRTKEVQEIDKCLIAVDTINASDLFSRNWKGDERLRVSVSSLNQININRAGRSISGPTQLHEVVEDYRYTISPESFWQSHKNAPRILLELAMKFMDLKSGDRVCDLYGGAGFFTLPISKNIGDAGEVHLIESDKRCIQDAKKMFKKNKNIIIHAGKVEEKLSNINDIDLILLDPPRNGAGNKIISEIIEKKPRSILYISCDPASLARDAKLLIDDSYSLEQITGIDLFPMTHHIECVSCFSRK
ncbi:MAG: TRAM domain-containing protein [Nitrospinota bacterium]|nr:TRAM domain-containing protein [Nitrospinota bacterium]